MKLCFDATRFGTGLQEAVELAAEKNLAACEFAFDIFDESETGALSSAESDYLKSVAELSQQHEIEIACLKLKMLLKVSKQKSVDEFKFQISKLSKIARELACKRLLFYLEAEPADDWLSQVEAVLNPIIDDLRAEGQTLVLSLSTPENFIGKSLRVWRPIEPQEWRELLAGIPGLCLSFSVADCAWQGIDYLRILSSMTKAIDHVEAQDVQVNRQIVAENGVFGPLWWRYMTVGKGQVDWGQFVEALKLYEYSGSLSIQFKDEFSCEDESGLLESLETSIKVLAPLVKY